MNQFNSNDMQMLEFKNTELELDNLRLLSLVEKLVEALQWCGGSDAFALEGEARHGWERGILPLLETTTKEVQKIKGKREYWSIQ